MPQSGFLVEAEKMSKSNKQTTSQLDGFTSDDAIAESLCDKYKRLFSSAPTTSQEYDFIFDKLNVKLMQDSFMYSINVDEVIKGIKCLNQDKSDGDRGTFSNHFIHASQKFIVILTSMINSMIVPGHSPNELLNAILINIPKDLRGSMQSSDNYRGIALCSAITKIVDYIFLGKHADILHTSDLQFAFKDENSTTMCTSVIK